MTVFQHLSPLGIHSLPFHPTCGGIFYPRTCASQAPPFRHVSAPLHSQVQIQQQHGRGEPRCAAVGLVLPLKLNWS